MTFLAPSAVGQTNKAALLLSLRLALSAKAKPNNKSAPLLSLRLTLSAEAKSLLALLASNAEAERITQLRISIYTKLKIRDNFNSETYNSLFNINKN